MSGSPKGKIERNKGGLKKGTGLLSLPEVTLTRGAGVCNNGGRRNNNGCPPLRLPLCVQKQQSTVRAQIRGIWRTGSFMPTLVPRSCCKPLWVQVHSCLPGAWAWVAAAILTAEIHLVYPSKAFPGSCQLWTVESSSIVTWDTLPVKLLSRWGED